MKRGREKVVNAIVDRRGQSIEGQVARSVDYNDGRFWGGDYRDCEWDDCKFNRTSFANGITFRNCRFIRCSFLTAHSSIHASFQNCIFEDCTFKGTLIEGTLFEDCVLSGLMKDMVFFGKGVEAKHRIVLRNVDMTGMKFELTDFRRDVDLSTTTFGSDPGSLTINDQPYC